MKRKLLIVVGVALVAATISTVVFYQLISGSLANNSAQHAERTIVTAGRDLPRGTRLTVEDLKVVNWAGETPPAGAFHQPDLLEGRLIEQDVRQGDPVVEGGLAGPGKGGSAGAIPQGMRAVSIHLSEFAGVTRMLENGDRVDVLAADTDRRPGNIEGTLHTVLQGVQVLDAGKDEETATRRNAMPVVTLLVEAKDVETLSLADQVGAIRLSLRNPLDNGTEATSGTRWSDIANKRTGAEAQERINRPRPRITSEVREPKPASAVRIVAKASDLPAMIPELHMRRPGAPALEEIEKAEKAAGKVLLSITFAGLGDEALEELSSGLSKRDADSPLILSAFRPGWDVQERVRALREKQNLQIFADPSLMALEQTEARFERSSNISDGPWKGWDGANANGCQDRVGVRVSFLTRVGKDKSLRIRVTSEVATPDASAVAKAPDCTTTRVATREWQSEIELVDGQSFWVRGLIDRPGAWDLLRRLFPRQPLEHDRNDELAILVTPKLVAAEKQKMDQPLSAVRPQ